MTTHRLTSRIKDVDRMLLLRQFATLIHAGIPLIPCCDLLEKSQDSLPLRLLLFTIKHHILSGKTLTESLQIHRQYFDELTIALVQIGETTGKLNSILNLIADHYEQQLTLKDNIKRALFYPMVISIAGVCMSFSLIIFVVPRFAALFNDFPDKLPFITRCLFSFSTLLSTQLLPGFLFVLSFSLLIFFKPVWRKKLRQFLLTTFKKLPWVKPLHKKMILTRFTRHLAITLSAGLPILEALTLSARPCGQDFNAQIEEVSHSISDGIPLHQAMNQYAYFPPLMIQLIKTGEESGKLPAMLEKLALYFAQEVKKSLDHFCQLLEPLIMLMQGVLIGGLVIGMYLPIFNLGSTL